MRREPPPQVLRGYGAVLVLALLSLPLSSACTGSEPEECPSGRVCPEGQKCAAQQDTCIATDCGDGTLQAGEACDDGNIIDGDGCSRTCMSTESCGNGIVDVAASEVCDDGNTTDGDGCSADCKSSELCGNGILDRAQGEVCDDANTQSGDGCSADCLSLEQCGNGYVDTAAGELCDDGNTQPGDGCGADCRAVEVCGDGVRDLGEACDDGNTTTESECAYGTPTCTACDATCSATLQLTGRSCGDGSRNDASEVCDDGNTINETSCPYGQASCTTCNATCTATLQLTGGYCGDGAVSHDEVCDDGNTTNETACPYGTPTCTSCNATCTATLALSGAYCGDGIVDSGEVCDDGNTTSGDGCNADCRLSEVCGDGVRGPGEVCDDGNTTTETACPYGTPTCTACNATCSAVLNLMGGYCGDGTVNGGEVCDDGNTLACGTCDAACSANQLAKASGQISITDVSSLKDRETFTLNDGIHPPVVFEFDNNGSVSSPRIRVNIAGLSTSTEAALSIVTAINGVGTELQISATSSGNIVTLTNDMHGTFGNTLITETVTGSGFRVNGMSGGAGYDCPEGTRCAVDADCDIGGLVCRPDTRTCALPPP
ncbi:DUF4215 domain-containing protein [Archangium violaceum]|uniref:DUF4215 domain-containing protein n=1 Tax=Archangium violaceum TaxID=83451 RepID=UPI00193C0580|nr:DUF4215 domain-containing protein [Archangium violaceum]QRK11816.1 DUF4215 domain-containing protein [Archangium violaceum]